MSVGQIVGIAGAFAVPIVLLSFGWLFMHGLYPKHPNGICGYRTTRSMKNDETWAFAQQCWGRLSWRVGWWLLILTLLGVSTLKEPFVRRQEICVGVLIAVQGVLTLGTILPVERALKNKFDEFGRRRTV